MHTRVKAEYRIRKQRLYSRASGRGPTAFYPLVEKKLHEEFKAMRKDGKIVKQWWFNNRVKQLLKESNPAESNFKKSDCWFFSFCRRYCVSLRRKTHTAQKAPEQLKHVITKFHAKLLRERMRGSYKDCDIANMDQTPLPLVLDDGKTYDTSGAKEVWCASWFIRVT